MQAADEEKIPRYALLSAAAAILVILSDYLLAYSSIKLTQTVSVLGIFRVVLFRAEVWRIPLSLYLALIGIPCWIPGFCALRAQLARTNPAAAKFFYIASIAAASGGIFIHCSLCLTAIAQHAILKGAGASAELQTLALSVLDDMIVTVLPAFFVFCVTVVLISQLTFIITVLRGRTIYRKWCVVFNSVTFMLLSIVISQLRHESHDWMILASCPAGYLALFVISALHEHTGVRVPRKQ